MDSGVAMIMTAFAALMLWGIGSILVGAAVTHWSR
jgi:hypothetical protein